MQCCMQFSGMAAAVTAGSSSGLPHTLPPRCPAAFNTVGVEHLGAGNGSAINGQQLTMLFAGPKGGAPYELAQSVIAGVGFVPKYVGPIRYARNLDAIAELWIHLSIPGAGETHEDWGRNFHFQVIERSL